MKRAIDEDTGTLIERFDAVRAASSALAAPLSAEDCAVQSMPDASPTKWHLGHTTWFFETFVLEGRSGYRTFDPGFRVIFNSYYNTVGAQHPRPRRGMLTRPGFERVLDYRAHVDRAMRAALDADGEDAGTASVVEVGLQHEQQHQELVLTDIKHLLSLNPANPPYREVAEPDRVEVPAPRWASFDEQVCGVGHRGEGFCFDNERPRHNVLVPACELASRPVTQGEWLEFMRDGGYTRADLWLADGWSTVQERGWRAPLYWREHDGTWFQFTLSGLRPVRADLPVHHVSYYEADAYARWAGARLPTEQEWERAAEGVERTGNFVERDWLQPIPSDVTSREGGVLRQMFGDVWEWTQSPYVAYPGYRPPAGALGEYNGKFMCNQLVLRGGSCATPASHIRATYRNFFYPHQRWQFCGLRLARDAA